MVMFTGLWNHSSFIQNLNNNYDDNDVGDASNNHCEEDQSLLRLGRHNRRNQHDRSSYRRNQKVHQEQQQPPVVPRTIEYGSIFAQATADQEKTVNWDNSDTCKSLPNNGVVDDDEEKNGGESYINSNVKSGGATCASPAEASSSGSGSVSSSSHTQDFPSLTAAFQSIENRPILINCFTYLAIYLVIAVLAYSFVLEKWSIIDSLYFAVATFTTCGYGDHAPTTVPGKIFTIFFAIYGVTILGVFIAIFGSFISEYQNKAMKRFQKKKQSQMLETLFPTGSSSIRPQPNQNPNQRLSTTMTASLSGSTASGASLPASPSNHKSCTNNILQPQKEEALLQDSGFWQDHVSLAYDIWRVVYSEFPLIVLVAIMALILGIREGWGFTSTLYFCIMAATTTGYGDYTPKLQLDKLYCVFFLPLAVAVFGEVLGRIATVYIQRKQRFAQLKFLHRSLTLCDIRNMDSNEDGKVDREDFVTFMLVALQKVDRQTIDELRNIFESLDTNGNGLLEENDLLVLAEENYLPTVKRIHKEYKQTFYDCWEDNDEDDDQPLDRDDLGTEPVAACISPGTLKHRRVHTVL